MSSSEVSESEIDIMADGYERKVTPTSGTHNAEDVSNNENNANNNAEESTTNKIEDDT